MTRHRSPLVALARRVPHDLGLAALVVAVLLSALAATVPGSKADLTAAVTNSDNTVGTADYFTCAGAISANSPRIYYKLDETSTTTTAVADSSGGNRNGVYRGTVVKGGATACARDTGTAVTFNGSNGYVNYGSTTQTTATAGYTGEAWIKTTSTRGGLILGFGGSSTGASTTVDRVLYMTSTGRLVFGINTTLKNTIASSASYNDGAWHHVMVTAGSAGMRLYVDGAQVASATTTLTGSYSGFLRLGYDNLALWPNAPASNFFNGTMDEAAVYLTVLTAADAADHAAAGS